MKSAAIDLASCGTRIKRVNQAHEFECFNVETFPFVLFVVQNDRRALTPLTKRRAARPLQIRLAKAFSRLSASRRQTGVRSAVENTG